MCRKAIRCVSVGARAGNILVHASMTSHCIVGRSNEMRTVHLRISNICSKGWIVLFFIRLNFSFLYYDMHFA